MAPARHRPRAIAQSIAAWITDSDARRRETPGAERDAALAD
jgi:hypothetical protein